ncbi:MAG: deoxyribonuclease IV [Phycisphaeraceae bacterium]|nr:deoxyribonuclease IV [Phycisphaeraceae bacterium]
MMFGSHLSIAGGMENALLAARQLDMDCVQVFTKNQRQWAVKPLETKQIDAWFAAMDQTGIRDTVSHDSYLINLASPDPGSWKRSMALFEEEIRRCDLLAIPYLVTHPGSHMGKGEDKGLARIAEAFNRLHDKLPQAKVITCLEITAGQGTNLGYRFEHLAAIIEQVETPDRLAVCLDTAHLLAAGYDLTSGPGMKSVLRECDAVLGLDRVKVVHVNDSKVERGKRVDRHEHIGLGHVARTAFSMLVNSFPGPKVLETPKGPAPDGRPWDALNLAALRQMVRRGKSGKQKT